MGDSLGNAKAGALVGAGVGAVTGAAVGDSLDEIDAQNRQLIAQQLHRAVRPGAATSDEVIAMSQAGVDSQLIINHIRNNGVVSPPDVNGILRLSAAGVPTPVIEAMQKPPAPPAAVRVAAVPAPVVVEEHHYFGPPIFLAPARRLHYRRARPGGVSWGFSFSSD